MFAALLAIGFVAGLTTAVSPCVLPVLPILLAGGAGEGRRRPVAIVAGLVTSFAIFTLLAAWLLDRLGLPKDLLRNTAIAGLFVIAAALVFPQLAHIVSRPFERLVRAPATGGDGVAGGIVLGASLGLVFVPCAGPVLSAITIGAASLDFGWRTVALTIAYALGAALPMLAVAWGGHRFLRPRAQGFRVALGVVVALGTLAIVFNVDRKLQTALSDYTDGIQSLIEKSEFTERELREVTGAGEPVAREQLDDYGPAPDFNEQGDWINSKPLTLDGLRGKVVLIDFWTYSCINCLRTLPHLRAWDATYRSDGLVIVGVHTPEFAFEAERDNVEEAVDDLEVRYPVALDNDYVTWRRWGNQYWPAKYLIDRKGHVRYAHFGEGDYAKTELAIQQLLGEHRKVRSDSIDDVTPRELQTPETYLGWQRLPAEYVGSPVANGRVERYAFPQTALDENQFAFEGTWRVEAERAVAVHASRLRLRFRASEVFLVLAGTGTVAVRIDGKPSGTVRVNEDRLYTLVRLPRVRVAELELSLSPGLSAYAFTFGTAAPGDGTLPPAMEAGGEDAY